MSSSVVVAPRTVCNQTSGRQGRYSIAPTSGTVIGTGRRVMQLLLATSMAITGFVMTAVLLFVLFVDPVARRAYAEWMLGLIAVSGLILWSGVKLMRRRVLHAYR